MNPDEVIFYNKGFSTQKADDGTSLSIPSKNYKVSELIPLLEKNNKRKYKSSNR